jgi:hypothetical protein
MKREGAEGFAAVDGRSPTAKEESSGRTNGLDKLAPPAVGVGSIRGVADSRQEILHYDAGAQT